MDEATQSGAGDINEVEALFDDEPVQQDAQTNQDENQAPDDDIELDEGEQTDEQEEVEPDADPEVELKIDGKTEKRKLSQLVADAQKYEAANKRFEEAAAVRKEAEALKGRIPEQEKQLATVLDHYIRQSQAMMGQEPNWRELLAFDQQNGTRNYEMARLDWEQKQRDVMQAQQTKQMLDQREAEAQAASNSERLKSEQVKLIEAIPDWKDPSKAAEGAKAIDSYLAAQGIPAEQRGALDSAAVVLIARKAMLYDQALARKQAAQTAPKQVQQVEKPTVSARATSKSQVERMNAGKAFKNNPSVDTLASFFE